MQYQYYPGCSLEKTAKEYDISTRAYLDLLGVELTEIPDWNCCGASAVGAKSRLLSLCLSALNLALAEQGKKEKDGIPDILAPCSACYLNLKNAREKCREDPFLHKEVNRFLEKAGRRFSGRVQVRHLLDVLSNDIGPHKVAAGVKRPLTGLKIAPYYGCQALRPYTVFDDPEEPVSMEPLLAAAGAEVFNWPMGGKCCGASHITTHRDAGLALTGAILKRAKGADAVVCVCPMCQMNLEANQKAISNREGRDLSITVLYLPQLLGLAAGMDPKQVGLGLNLSVTDGFLKKLGDLSVQ